MKKHFTLSFILTALLLEGSFTIQAQQSPVWTRDITHVSDTAYVFPVQTLTDLTGNVIVLSTWSKSNDYKIYLNKFDAAGTLDWSLLFDNNGAGSPRGFAMAIDDNGDCYVAGGLMTANKPLLMKVSSSGNVLWQRDSTTVFNNGTFERLILKNNRLYTQSLLGVSMFSLTGDEIWTTGIPAGPMAVDNAGQAIVTVYFGNPVNIMRLDSTGAINFADTTINADKIATDFYNNFYLLQGTGQYQLVKYDSAGVEQWTISDLPFVQGFGDLGFDVLTDYNLDVILVGLADTIFKFNQAGNLLWKKSMDSLDSYITVAKITDNNFLAVAGSVPVLNGYDIALSLFDINGNITWTGSYNSNTTQEFSVDFAIASTGIFLIEDSISNTVLMKFDNPFVSGVIDFSLICVDSVWYDPNDHGLINVSVFNGNFTHINYPFVQIVSPAGDTISNVSKYFTFFAHGGNTYQTYTDTILDSTITNWSGYTFLISDGITDTTVVITWCDLSGISEYENNHPLLVYPNPVHDMLTVINNEIGKSCKLRIYNITGSAIFQMTSDESELIIDMENYADGIYFISLQSGNKIWHGKILKH